MKSVLFVFAIALVATFLAWPQTNSGQAKKSSLDGTWELASGQQLPAGTRDIKIISGGHFIFVAYDTETGKVLYTGGGAYTLTGSSYTEHIDFASDGVSPGLAGKDQPFAVHVEGDTFTQTGTLSNGKGWRKSGSGLTEPKNCLIAAKIPAEMDLRAGGYSKKID